MEEGPQAARGEWQVSLSVADRQGETLGQNRGLWALSTAQPGRVEESITD